MPDCIIYYNVKNALESSQSFASPKLLLAGKQGKRRERKKKENKTNFAPE